MQKVRRVHPNTCDQLGRSLSERGCVVSQSAAQLSLKKLSGQTLFQGLVYLRFSVSWPLIALVCFLLESQLVFAQTSELHSSVSAEADSQNSEQEKAGVSALQSSAPASQVASVQALGEFKKGKSALLKGEWTKAQDHFLSALQFKRTPGLLYHLAYTEERLDHYADAYEHYQLAAQLMEQVTAHDVAALLPAALGRVEAQVAILRVRGLADSSRILIDGHVKSALRFIAVDPGHHQLEVISQGYEVYRVEFDIRVGERVALELELIPLRADEEQVSSPAPQVAPVAQSGLKLEKVILYSGVTFAVTGTALLTTGLVIARTALAEQGRLTAQLEPLNSSACVDSDQESCAQLASAYQRTHTGRVLAVAGGVLLGLGFGGIVGGLMLKSDEVSYSLLPQFDHQSARLSLHGTF